MNQFKDVFLGTGRREYKRAADTQKVLRVSGKHNDLEEVGYSPGHHTFFEMLGNWSFGDYYKREAITYRLGINYGNLESPQRTPLGNVHDTDDESEKLWLEETDIPFDRIRRFDKDNFWEMGDTVPVVPALSSSSISVLRWIRHQLTIPIQVPMSASDFERFGI